MLTIVTEQLDEGTKGRTSSLTLVAAIGAVLPFMYGLEPRCGGIPSPSSTLESCKVSPLSSYKFKIKVLVGWSLNDNQMFIHAEWMQEAMAVIAPLNRKETRCCTKGMYYAYKPASVNGLWIRRKLSASG